MKYLLTSILILTSFLITSDPRERLMDLKKMDRDGNRAISFKEYSHKPLKIFKNMDSDSNGVLTYSEFSLKKLRPPRNKKSGRFSFLDINDDEKVSKKEFISGANKQPRSRRMSKFGSSEDERLVAEKIFLKLDVNQDQNIDVKELSVAKDIAPKVAKDHSFQNLNSDGNENITINEFLAPAKETFSRMDSNSDGSIERREIKEFMRNNKNLHKKEGKPFIMQKERNYNR